ncbi:unnamed protein product [Ixodes pacificus]
MRSGKFVFGSYQPVRVEKPIDMKIFLLCLILGVMVVIASGRNEHHCQKGDAEITTLASCIVSKAPDAHTQALIKKLMDSMIKTLGCADIVCATRKVCDQGNLDETLKKYFPDPVIDILHELAESCDQQASQGRH